LRLQHRFQSPDGQVQPVAKQARTRGLNSHLRDQDLHPLLMRLLTVPLGAELIR
jgi:hypothetical protein